MRRLRICYVGWGRHVHLERWASYFAELGHEVQILTFSDPGDSYPPGVRQIDVSKSKRRLSLKRLELKWHLWRMRPDVVHVHYAGFAPYVAGLYKAPLIVTAWGTDIYGLSELPEEDQKRLSGALEAAVSITCDSADLRRAIVELAPAVDDRVSIIQWGVNTDHFVRARDTAALRSRLGIGHHPVVLSVRNFTPLYNLETIVRAFALVLETIPDAVLILKFYRGDPVYRDKIMEMVAHLGIAGSVRLVDSVPYAEMPALYSIAAVSVSVPFSDATPMSMLEAMACGTVPICSDLPSLREWIVEGENGFLVPPEDSSAIAERIAWVLRNPVAAHEIAARNRRHVEERASQHHHMAEMQRIYESVTDD